MRRFFVHIEGTVPTATLGLGLAWLGVMIYAASHSIATLLVDIGAAQPVAGGRNAITFSNLLFLGSVISLLPMAALFYRDCTRANLRGLSRKDWGFLTLSAFLSSALTPGLFFFALEHSSVTNVVLITRIEPPLFLLAAGFVLRERIPARPFAAGLIALLGAVLMIGMRAEGGITTLGLGESAAIVATLSYVASAIVARRTLQRVPMGIFSIYRTAVGAALYFALISILRGPDQFQDLFSPVLLSWIWVYAVPVIIVGQLAWFIALKYAKAGDMSLATSASPLAGLFFAMLLLGENPGAGFVPGAILILMAIYVGQMHEASWQKLRGTVEKPVSSLSMRLTKALPQLAPTA